MQSVLRCNSEKKALQVLSPYMQVANVIIQKSFQEQIISYQLGNHKGLLQFFLYSVTNTDKTQKTKKNKRRKMVFEAKIATQN